jgi:hypothetical protein
MLVYIGSESYNEKKEIKESHWTVPLGWILAQWLSSCQVTPEILVGDMKINRFFSVLLEEHKKVTRDKH